MKHVMNMGAFLLNEARSNDPDFERFEEISEEFVYSESKGYFPSSLTVAANTDNRRKPDWKVDYKKMVKFYEERGMDLKTLKTVVKNNISNIDSSDGIFATVYFDMFFYELTGGNKNVAIGGAPMLDYKEDMNGLIRFAYGWHKTSYGKLFIKHHVGNEKKWFGVVKTLFVGIIPTDSKYSYYTYQDVDLKKLKSAVEKSKFTGGPVCKFEIDLSYAEEAEIKSIISSFENDLEENYVQNTITHNNGILTVVMDFK